MSGRTGTIAQLNYIPVYGDICGNEPSDGTRNEQGHDMITLTQLASHTEFLSRHCDVQCLNAKQLLLSVAKSNILRLSTGILTPA